MMKKLISLILTICMLCVSLGTIACAEAASVTRDSKYLTSYGTPLSKVGGGTIKIIFSTDATQVADTLGVVSYQVFRRNSSNEWVECSGLLSGKTASNVGSYTFSKYFYGISGETYRVTATFVCTIDGKTEYKNYTSLYIET